MGSLGPDDEPNPSAVESRSDAPEQGKLSRWVADLCLLTTTLIWGGNILVFKYALAELNPWVFNASRLVLATLTLGVCVWCERRWSSGRKAESTQGPPPYRQIIFYSLIAAFLYQLVFVLGIRRTTAGNTALLLASMPMWTAVISFFWIRERLARVTWFGLMLTFFGTAIVTLQSGRVDLSSAYLEGNLLVLGAAFLWGLGTVYSRPILQVITPLQLAFWSSVLTLPLHFAIALPHLSTNWEHLQRPEIGASLFYSGAMSTGIAYATWHVGVRQLGGSHASVYQNIVTLVALLGGWLFLHEQPQAIQLFGGCCMILGMLAMRRGRT